MSATPRHALRGATAAALIALTASAASALERRDLELPGPWLQLGAGGGSGWVLAATGSQAKRSLFELHWPAGTFTNRGTDLSSDVTHVVPQPGGSPILTGGDVAWALGDGSATTPLETAGDALLAREEEDVSMPPPFLALAEVGSLRAVTLAGATLQTAGDVQRFPAIAERKSWGFEVSAPPLHFVGPWLAVGPQQQGRTLRTVLIDGKGGRIEAKALLPGGEQMAESTFVWLANRPLLVVGSFRGLGIVSHKQLRVFALPDAKVGDGNGPAVAMELAARAWQDLRITTGDVDGDGRDDLLIASDSHLSGHTVAFTAFLTRGDGRLASTPVLGEVDLGDAEWRVGDFDGDHRPDLLTLDKGKLGLRRGGAGKRGLPGGAPQILAELGGYTDGDEKPTEQVEVQVGDGKGHVEHTKIDRPSGWQLVDLDGDGAVEAVVWGPIATDRVRLTVVGH